MKRTVLLMTVLFLMAELSLAVTPRFGVGAFGGLEIPIVQDVQDQGNILGIRGRVSLTPMITLEPRLHFSKYGDPSFDEFTADLDGSKVTAFGVDALVGTPFSKVGVFGIVGVGSYKIKRDQTGQDESDIGWSGGLGLEFGLTPQVAIDARGLFILIPSEGGGSKKSIAIFTGVNFHFGQ